jgi:hypothetical protein
MIPEFDEHGYFPPGIHKATIEEINQRFGCQSELRRVQMESLHWLIDLLRGKSIKRFIINGSFTTDEYEPNDVDCIIMFDESFYFDDDILENAFVEFPFLDIQVVKRDRLDFFVEQFFSTDRRRIQKGMIEVLL